MRTIKTRSPVKENRTMEGEGIAEVDAVAVEVPDVVVEEEVGDKKGKANG